MTTLNLYQKLLEVRKSIPYLKKEASANNGGGGFQGYNYNSSSQVIGSVRQKLDELGVLLVTKITDKRLATREKVNAKGNVSITYEIEVDLEFTWINAENPTEQLVIPWFGMGLDTGDNAKALGKALTYAEKYFMLKEFNIPTNSDDPDYFQQQMEATVVTSAGKDQLDQLATMAQEFGQLRGQTVAAVYKALGVKDIAKLTKGEAMDSLKTLEAWITAAKKAAAKAEKEPQQPQQ